MGKSFNIKFDEKGTLWVDDIPAMLLPKSEIKTAMKSVLELIRGGDLSNDLTFAYAYMQSLIGFSERPDENASNKPSEK